MHFVVVAAAEGAKAGVTINKELLKEYPLATYLNFINMKNLKLLFLIAFVIRFGCSMGTA